MLTIEHRLVLGDREFTSHVVRLRCERSVAPGVGLLRVRLPYLGDLPAQVGDDVLLDLDSGDEAAGSGRVFTGTVAALRHSAAGVEVIAGDAAWTLAQLRPRATYEGQTAGEVVSALADEAGVACGAVESGPKLAGYVADGASTGWEHVARLAAWSRADAWVGAGGDIVTRAVDGTSADKAVRWGREVLAVGSTQAPLPTSGVAAAGEGPGPADAHPGAFRISATGVPPAPPVAVRYRPGLRGADAAAAATTGWLIREATRRRPVELHTLLLPGLEPGDVLEVQDAPVPVPLLAVRRVEHRIDRFAARTRVVARASADSDLLGALPGLLGGVLGDPAGALAGGAGGLL